MIASSSKPMPPVPQVRAESARPAGADSVKSAESGVGFAATLDREVKHSGWVATSDGVSAKPTQSSAMANSPPAEATAPPDSTATDATGVAADASGPSLTAGTKTTSKKPTEALPEDASAALAEIALVMMAGQQLQQVPQAPVHGEAEEQPISLGASEVAAAMLPPDVANPSPISSTPSPTIALPFGQAEPAKTDPLTVGAPIMEGQSLRGAAVSIAQDQPPPSESVPDALTDAPIHLKTLAPSKTVEASIDTARADESPAQPTIIENIAQASVQRIGAAVAAGGANASERPRADQISTTPTPPAATQAGPESVSADAEPLNGIGMSSARGAFIPPRSPLGKTAEVTSATGLKPAVEPGDALKSLIAELGLSLDKRGALETTGVAADTGMEVAGDSVLDAGSDIGTGLSTMAQMASGQIALEPRSGEPPKPVFSIPTPVGHEAWPKDLGETLVGLNRANLETAELKLNPNHLGPLDVRVRLGDDGSVAVNFTSAHAPVREAIQAASAQLREMLATQDIRLGELSISPPADASLDAASSQFSTFQESTGRDEPRTQSGLEGRAAIGREESGLEEEGAAERDKARNSGALSLYA